MKKKLVASLLLAGLLATGAQAAPAPLTAQQQTFRAIYQQLVEINTTHSAGDTTKAARWST